MAGSPRSPSLRDKWRGQDDHKNSEHSHPRPREKSDRRQRSPLPAGRRDRERPGRGRGGPSSSGPRYPHPRQSASWRGDKKHGSNRAESPQSRRPRSPQARHAKHSQEHQVRRPRQREVSLSPSPQRRLQPTGPPSKRRRSRSPSPHYPNRSHRSKRRDFAGFSQRGKRKPRPSPPPRERGRRRPNDSHPQEPISDRFSSQRGSKSPPPQDETFDVPPRGRSRTPSPPLDDGRLSRPSSRHSFLSRASRASSSATSRHPQSMQSTRPIQSVVEDSTKPPSPLRPIPSFDAAGPAHGMDDSMRDSFPMHSIPSSDSRVNRRPSRPPRLDTKQHYNNTSPQYVTPTTSRHASPQSGSPYSSGRGSWGGQQQPPPYHGQPRQMHGYSPPYRQGSYPPPTGSQNQYYQSQQAQYPPPNQMHQGYPGPPYRGGHPSYRGSNYGQPPDRRFSGSNTHNYSNPPPQGQRSRGGGHFTSLQWTASGGRGRGNAPPIPPHSQPDSTFLPAEEPASPDFGEDDNPFRPSKDLQVEDEDSVNNHAETADAKKMPPPSRQHPTSSEPKETGKFSFAFKSKAAPTPAPKPVPDLAQRMQEPPRSFDSSKNRQPAPPVGKGKNDSRFERRDDRRDSSWRNDRRYDRRDDRRRDRRDERRPEPRYERRKERSPPPPREKPKKKKILQRIKPRPTLSEEFSQSDSVYYRKPGNESVIGAGTYGKVFKAIHVFTKNRVALKRIRMEGEKDGFPITAVREIRLLQHLRHGNIVSLQEVMVEKNECFMVFEYLSHDLTGLINHPTFSLTPAHKKHLARQMFDGLNYLHHRGVLHRDIKAANILVSSQGELKYADFGLARFFSKSRSLDYTNRVITIWYRSPELLLGETRYGPAVDVWSAACVYMEMFTKKAIFPGDGSEINQLDKLYSSLGTPTRADWPGIVDMPWFELMRPTERKERSFEEQYEDSLSPSALDLVAKIFQYDPAKRPSTEEVLAHPYFTSEEPQPQQAIELASVEGDWHEFESKAHRKERDKEARRAEQQREREKRKAGGSSSVQSVERDPKRTKIGDDSAGSGGVENSNG